MPHQAGNYHKTTCYTTESMDCVGSRIPIEEISALRSPSKEELAKYIYPPYNVAIHKPSYNLPSFHYPGRGVKHSIILILPHQFLGPSSGQSSCILWLWSINISTKENLHNITYALQYGTRALNKNAACQTAPDIDCVVPGRTLSPSTYKN